MAESTCVRCGDSFTMPPKRSGPVRTRCFSCYPGGGVWVKHDSPPQPRTCSYCLQDFTPARNRTARYCSDGCRTREQAGTPLEATCRICGATFSPKQRISVVCPRRACRKRAWSTPEARERERERLRAEGKTAEYQRRYRATEAGRARQHEYDKARGSGKKRSSAEARALIAQTRATRRRVAAQRRLASAAAGTTSRRLWIAGPCICGRDFVSCDGSRHCAPWCGQRQPKRPKMTSAQRLAVFERDAWTCRLCGFPVSRGAQVPDLEAPTIDHIVPLAAGGAHAPSNWQTAHFWCNSYKRDRLDVLPSAMEVA